jgi:hypothetical protein
MKRPYLLVITCLFPLLMGMGRAYDKYRIDYFYDAPLEQIMAAMDSLAPTRFGPEPGVFRIEVQRDSGRFDYSVDGKISRKGNVTRINLTGMDDRGPDDRLADFEREIAFKLPGYREKDEYLFFSGFGGSFVGWFIVFVIFAAAPLTVGFALIRSKTPQTTLMQVIRAVFTALFVGFGGLMFLIMMYVLVTGFHIGGPG